MRYFSCLLLFLAYQASEERSSGEYGVDDTQRVLDAVAVMDDSGEEDTEMTPPTASELLERVQSAFPEEADVFGSAQPQSAAELLQRVQKAVPGEDRDDFSGSPPKGWDFYVRGPAPRPNANRKFV